MLANRLQKILPVLISKEQSTFVPWRNITDNILVDFELIHFMKRKTSGEVGDFAYIAKLLIEFLEIICVAECW